MTNTMVEELEAVIARQIEDGNYRSFDEAFAAMKAILTDPVLVEKARTTWLQREVQKGKDSGGEIPAEDVFADARERLKTAQ